MRNNTIRVLKFIILTALISALMLFAASAANVVYLKDGGTGDGSSPDNAVGTLTKAHGALDLTADDATIVVCGPYTQAVNWVYGAGEYTGTVTFTSVYDGVDYRESADAVYNIGKYRFMCLGNNRFENLNINCTGEYCLLVGQHYDVTIGEGVSITGESLLGTAIANSFTVIGGYQSDASLAVAESDADTNVTVLSGENIYIVPFSRGIENGKFTGTANVTIGGTAKVAVLHGSSANPDGVTLGDVNITLKDSAVIDKFYGCTNNVTVNSYTFNYNGGTINKFYWVCPNTADKVLTVTGTKKLVVGGDVDYHAIMDEFDTISGGDVAFLKDGGTGDGSNLEGAASTLKAALANLDLSKDCTVVICGPFTQGSDFAYGKKFTGSLTFTSVFDGVDYRTENGANWQFDGERFACYGATTFENIDFVSLGGNYMVAAQHNAFTLGEGITVSGDNLSATTLATSFCIIGGYVSGLGHPTAIDKNAINVTVISGSKIYIVPFSHNMQGTYKGTANITIGGSANIGVLHGSCVGAKNRKLGDLRVTVKDNAIVNRFYGATSEANIINSVEFFFESGRIYNLKWSTATSVIPTISNPTVLHAADKAAASQYYAAVAGMFDVVINSESTDTDVVPAAPSAEETAVLDARAGSKAYTAMSFTSDKDKPQVSIKLPASATDGKLYRVAGDYILTLDADALGNGHIGFDLTENGTYICSDTDFITYGDVDYDGNISVADTLLTLKIVLGDNTIDKSAADVDDNQKITFLDVMRQLKMVVAEDKPAEEFTFNPDDYNVISVDTYLDKTKLGFLSQMVGFLSGYEFARDPETNLPMLAMDDSYFEMCNGPYAEYKEINQHGDKLLLNEETGIWEVWNDDDFSIDILNQYILRDMYAQYGTVNTKVITDDWVKYDVYDMGGGNRDIGAYGLMKNYRYLSIFSGNTEMCNNFNVNGEPYIGNETLGMNAPGMPDLAVDLAHNFGSTTSDRDPLEWLRMIAAMYSMAYFEDDIPTLIRTAQAATMTEGSWPYEVVDECFNLYEKHPDDWRAAVIEADQIFRSYNYDNPSYMGCTSINCSFIILGLLYGDGDYYETCKIISLAGHGGDSTTPTALGVVGVVTGWENLDTTSKTIINEKVWQDGEGIIVNRPLDPDGSYGTWMHMAGLEERFAISDLLDMYQANFENLLYENGGFKLDGNYYIPKQTISKVDTVYTEHFENGGLSSYTATRGTIANPDDPFMGANALELTAAASGDSVAYTTVSGLTVGETYKLSAFIRTSDGVTAHMFVRESGEGITHYETVHDSNVYVRRFTTGVGENDMCSYVKRELVFTATKASMEIGLMLPAGTIEGGSVAFDAVQVIRFEETKLADVTVNGAKDENGVYSGQVRFDIDGGSEKEAWLKITYSSNATALEKAFTCVNRVWQSRTPIVPTNGGNVTIYIPVLVNKDESNLVTMYFDNYDVTIHEAELVMPKDRF